MGVMVGDDVGSGVSEGVDGVSVTTGWVFVGAGRVLVGAGLVSVAVGRASVGARSEEVCVGLMVGDGVGVLVGCTQGMYPAILGGMISGLKYDTPTKLPINANKIRNIQKQPAPLLFFLRLGGWNSCCGSTAIRPGFFSRTGFWSSSSSGGGVTSKSSGGGVIV